MDTCFLKPNHRTVWKPRIKNDGYAFKGSKPNLGFLPMVLVLPIISLGQGYLENIYLRKRIQWKILRLVNFYPLPETYFQMK
jgi:hypothetical protein